MNIGNICQRNVVTVRQFDELRTAPQLMREKHIGYLIVVEPNLAQGGVSPTGVLTDRDIVIAVVASGADVKALRVGDVKTRKPVTVVESASLASVHGRGCRYADP